jgi:hypothetical protein
MEEGKWIKAFETKAEVSRWGVSFLWNSDNVYIMDNHLAALWCWNQHLDRNKDVNLFHIDAHYDTSGACGKCCYAQQEIICNLREIDFARFEGLTCTGHDGQGAIPLVWYDNFIWVLVAGQALGAYRFSKIVLATQEDEPLPQFEGIRTIAVQETDLLDRLQVELTEGQWIVDLDIDYFFDSSGKDLTYTSDRIGEICYLIRDGLSKGLITTLTIALSPSCSGGWPKAVEVCGLVCEKLDLKFPVDRLYEKIHEVP